MLIGLLVLFAVFVSLCVIGFVIGVHRITDNAWREYVERS